MTAATAAVPSPFGPSLLLKRRRVQLAARPGVPPNAPNVALDRDHVLVTLFPEGQAPAGEPGELVLLEKAGLGEAARVPVGHKPRWLAVDQGRRRAYVVNWGQPPAVSLSVVDLDARAELARTTLNQGAIGVAVDPVRGRVYVPSWTQRRLHVLDAAGTRLADVEIAGRPTAADVDPATGLVYVTCAWHNTPPFDDALVVVDGAGATPAIVGRIAHTPRAGFGPVRVVGERVYVGTSGGGPGVPPVIAVFARSGTGLTRLPDVPARGVVTALAHDPATGRLHAAVGASVQVLDVTGPEPVPAGLGAVPRHLHDLAVDPAAGLLYATDRAGAVVHLRHVEPSAGFSLERDLGLLDAPVRLADGVEFLGAGIPPRQVIVDRPTNVSAADTTNTDALQPGGELGLDLDGSGLAVGIWEATEEGTEAWAIRATHRELTGRVTVVEPGEGVSDHATHVAGTIGAAGVDPAARGMAVAVALQSHSAGFDATELDTAAPGLVASNHSYGPIKGWDEAEEIDTENDGTVTKTDVWRGDYAASRSEDAGNGAYTRQASAIDEVLFRQDHLVSVWSAGNERNDGFTNRHGDETYVTYLGADPGLAGLPFTEVGWYRLSTELAPPPGSDGDGGTGFDSIAGEAVAKNTLTVGAVEDLTDDPYDPGAVRVTDFTSWGPTDDGRVKPDLVANGRALRSSVGTGDADYRNMQGTSMAAPNVTGTAVLLIARHRELFGTSPRSSTVKGLLVHTAADATTTGLPGVPRGLMGPDYAHGWGLVDARAAAEHLRRAAAGEPGVRVEELRHDGEDQQLTVEAPGSVLKVTIAWTDRAAPERPEAIDDRTPVLVHDLDLSVVGPDGRVHHPWTLDPADPTRPARQDRPNRVDNVEQVVLVLGEGTYTVRVASASGSALQEFALLQSVEPFDTTLTGGQDWGEDRHATHIAFGDVDGDGRAEVGVVRDADEGPRFYLLDDALAHYALLHEGGVDWGEDRNATHIAFGDVDGDGRDEVGVVRNAGEGPRFYVLDDAHAGFALLHEGGADWGEGIHATSIAFGDVDDDGRAEVGVTRDAGEGPRFYVLDDAHAGFALLHEGGVDWGDGRHATSIAFGDVDDDERAEVAITRDADEGPRFYVLDDAHAGFALLHEGGVDWGEGIHATSIALGDVDDDRRAEVGVTRDAGEGPRFYVLDDAHAGFTLLHEGGVDWGEGIHATSVAFGHVDGDGRAEVAITRDAGEGPRFYVLDDAHAGFALLREGGTDWGEDRHATRIALGDADGDGDAEVGVTRDEDEGPRFFVLEA